jgi:hypothetical protein
VLTRDYPKMTGPIEGPPLSGSCAVFTGGKVPFPHTGTFTPDSAAFPKGPSPNYPRGRALDPCRQSHRCPRCHHSLLERPFPSQRKPIALIHYLCLHGAV